MFDHPEKTPRLLAALRAAAPFEVELLPSLIEQLQAENVVNMVGCTRSSGTCHTPAMRAASCAICLARKKQEEHSLCL